MEGREPSRGTATGMVCLFYRVRFAGSVISYLSLTECEQGPDEESGVEVDGGAGVGVVEPGRLRHLSPVNLLSQRQTNVCN